MASNTYAGGQFYQTLPGYDPNFDFDKGDSDTTVLSNGNILVVWSQLERGAMFDETHVMGQIMDASGAVVVPAFQINTDMSEERNYADATALSGGGFVVTWRSTDQDGDGEGVYMQRYNNAGTPQGLETLVNNVTTGDQSKPYVVGLSGGGYYVFWESIVPNNGGFFTTTLMGQKYTAVGVEVGGEVTVSSTVASGFLGTAGVFFDSISAVELTGGEVAISWTNADYTSGQNSKTRIAVIDNSGTLQAGFVEPEQTNDGPSHPQENIVALGNGNLMVIYSYGYFAGGTGTSGQYGELYGRIYDETLTAIGNEFVIAGGTDNRRFQNGIASDGNGGVVVVYVQEHEETSGYNLMMQQITQSGNVLGDPIHLGPMGGARNGDPSLDVLPNGDIVVFWQTGIGNGTLQFRIIKNGEDARFSNNADTVVLNNSGEAVVALQGSDSIEGGSGDDFISGGTGHDTISGQGGSDVLEGGSGRDELRGNTDDDLIFGGAGDDTIFGGADNDTIDGGNDDDEIYGGSGDDLIHGGDGADTLFGDGGNDTIYGFANQYEILEPGEVRGGMVGGVTLFGGDGNDRLIGTFGDDYFDGGEGNDIYIFSEFGLPSGRDLFKASNGNDTFFGRDLDDTADYSTFGSALIASIYTSTVNSESIEIQKTAYAGYGIQEDILRQVANLVGTAFDDYLVGNVHLVGMNGMAGNDTLIGSNAEDRLQGDIGNDTLDGGGGRDSLYGGIGDDELTGGGQSDYLRGADGFDLLVGNGGADELIGGSGGDTLYGGGGKDTLNGGDNHDVAEGGDGEDVIDGGGSGDVLRGNADQDTIFGGSGNDKLYGGSSRDELRGNTDNDRLYGGTGADRLYGDGGDDTLDGGLGGDTFVFDGNAADGTDTIIDWEDGTDLIEIGGSIVFADLTISVVGSDTHVDWTGNTIVIEGVTSGITASDFDFV